MFFVIVVMTVSQVWQRVHLRAETRWTCSRRTCVLTSTERKRRECHQTPSAHRRRSTMNSLLPECPASYKSTFGHLRALRIEIEHLQLLLGRARTRLNRDFQKWWSQHTSSGQVKHPSV